ncbi:transcriptional regulator [Bacillus thuringiensis]|uniref:Transcriptional regulator n=1 Tax=Bacillus cereus TaxID=1396 RepID=A0A9X7BED8_BACCE|nr:MULTISPECIES: helix-turn-helix transcriptional regulator [Bacillus cereus group]PED43035.1 transcriptional regulator [Bacillus cereus]PFV09672.1 transcriptional regulator [Bacillus cereus]PGL90666.1 transcriptional regulator [Bacillus thuringiensis]PRT32156.1 XRE family transcriptional regulator [Bacillus thuringiensis]
MRNFGAILRELRKEEKITQKELALTLKLSESTIGMYERNERQPDYDTLNRIANYFGVTTDFLLGRTNNYKKSSSNDILNDPELGLWFKDIKEASPEKREELQRFWEFIILNEKTKDKK